MQLLGYGQEFHFRIVCHTSIHLSFRDILAVVQMCVINIVRNHFENIFHYTVHALSQEVVVHCTCGIERLLVIEFRNTRGNSSVINQFIVGGYFPQI
jgi:predicted protein tyrosine phosphatase